MQLEDIIKTRGFENDHHRAIVNLMQLNYELKLRMKTELKLHGLTLEQFNILRILNGQYGHPLSITEIQNRMIERSSNCSRIVDRLETKSLVYRKKDSTDKRNIAVCITASGMLKIDQASKAMRRMEGELLKLNAADVNMLNVILDKARNVLYKN
ncbi:MAG: MarR family transcriptional regulator [Bacteroidetes bacterium]|nr:MarR family transcriptional regulator [Bacteroidota bacterium]